MALGVVHWQGSPTFALVNEYDTAPRLYHVDLYRLSGHDAEELGLEEYVRDDSLVVVEWANRAPGLLADLARRAPTWVDIGSSDDNRREILVHPPSRHRPPDFEGT
jgi:tRNA threonylcarbamoyladenosine biosynthesis protein TsaE